MLYENRWRKGTEVTSLLVCGAKFEYLLDSTWEVNTSEAIKGKSTSELRSGEAS